MRRIELPPGSTSDVQTYKGCPSLRDPSQQAAMVRIDISLAFFAFLSLVSAAPTEGSVNVVGIPISRKVDTLTAAELVAKEKLRIGSFANAAVGNQPITNKDGMFVHVLIFYSPY